MFYCQTQELTAEYHPHLGEGAGREEALETGSEVGGGEAALHPDVEGELAWPGDERKKLGKTGRQDTDQLSGLAPRQVFQA